MTSSQVPDSTSTPDEADEHTTAGDDGVESYSEGVFEQGKERPSGEHGQGVFEQGHAEPGGEGVFQQGHVEREQGTGVYDQDDEKPASDN
jgi:hypothetical protein